MEAPTFFAPPIAEAREQVRLAISVFGNISMKHSRVSTSREVLDAMTGIFKTLKELDTGGNPATDLYDLSTAFQYRYITDPLISVETARQHLEEIQQDCINWFVNVGNDLGSAMAHAKVFAWRFLLFLAIVTGLELTTQESDLYLVELDAIAERLLKLVATTDV